jgi:hypothetical protein
MLMVVSGFRMRARLDCVRLKSAGRLQWHQEPNPDQTRTQLRKNLRIQVGGTGIRSERPRDNSGRVRELERGQPVTRNQSSELHLISNGKNRRLNVRLVIYRFSDDLRDMGLEKPGQMTVMRMIL